jgi:hypothetical protein
MIHLKRDGSARACDLFWRPLDNDRRLQSLNDWYGIGVLRGLDVDLIDGRRCCWFAGKTASQSSYLQGIRDGRALRA